MARFAAKTKGKESLKANSRIRAHEVRLVDAESNQLGVMSTPDALKVAEEAGLDLVEVSPNAVPPVCRIMDYGKYKYQMSKKAHEAKKKQSTIQVKMIKFRTRTDKHDFDFKLRNIKRFLGHGDKVKCLVFFRGREITHLEIGRNLLLRVVEEVGEDGVVEQAPKMEGRSMTLLLGPVNQPSAK